MCCGIFSDAAALKSWLRGELLDRRKSATLIDKCVQWLDRYRYMNGYLLCGMLVGARPPSIGRAAKDVMNELISRVQSETVY